jgi:uncharacterized membrane protein YoaK (UPF0700 family)
MSFFAGSMNAISFVGFGTFATHVTGFATLFGVHVASNHFGNAITALSVPLFFLAGSIISGLLVEARVRRQLKPHYDYVMYLSSFLLSAACIIGTFREKIIDPTYLHLEKNFVVLSLICLTSGLINAALSYSSRTTVRITHLTGITTDLGRGIAEMIALRFYGMKETHVDMRMNGLRALTILSFALGSVFGGFLYLWAQFAALLIPAAYFIYAGYRGKRT